MTEKTEQPQRVSATQEPPAPEPVPPAQLDVPPSPETQTQPETQAQTETETGPAAGTGTAPRKGRRVLRAALRWTAALVAFASVGAATGYGITRMERTDVPGLATEPDGRWEYPELTLPPLPPGSPAPFAEGNKAGAHHADLRKLVLPAPKGAKADKALAGVDGWLPAADFLKEYEPEDDLDSLGQMFTDHGLRHVAARGWTMPDGTHTRIYLLRFGTAAVADALYSDKLTQYNSPRYVVRGSDGVFSRDEDFAPRSDLADVERAAYVEGKPYGKEQVRQAYLSAGDTLALIVQSRKGATEALPFQQTVVLQGQLLG
ncbi:hypothetical protein [Streptomyces europaeiscabiei]|uniref:hypothetical protein n=1 Tax=Streptomyces europaeiscabiei TaxID=146819 RepID=UPI002E0F7C22|nr:hypothetical protein OHB30_26355 [Streptomyces europaeiscabiei]